MTVVTELASVTHTGNGVATTFNIPFKFISNGHIQVNLITIATGAATTLSPSVYSISGAGESLGGTLTYPLAGSPVAATRKVEINRVVPVTQDTAIVRYGGFYPDAIEERFDLLTMQIQQLKADLATAISGETITTITQNVAGPASSVNGNIVLFDGTTGALLKDAGVAVAGLSLSGHGHSFGSLSGKPTTISGYGITDLDDGVEAAMDAAFSAGTHTNVTITYDAGTHSFSFAVNDNPWIEVLRTSNSSITASTTLTNDSVLLFPIEANKNYLFETEIFMLSPAAVGYKIGLSGPALPDLVLASFVEKDSALTETLNFITGFTT